MIVITVPNIAATDVVEIMRYENPDQTGEIIASGVSLPYEDTEGTIYHWYSVRIINDPLNPSPWTPLFKGTASQPSLCTIKGYIYEMEGKPISGIEVVAIAEKNSWIQNVWIKHGDTVNAFSDSTGKWELSLIQGLTVRIKIPDLYFDKYITVPNQNEAWIEELI